MKRSNHCLYLFSAAELYFFQQQAHLINVSVKDSVFFLYDSIVLLHSSWCTYVLVSRCMTFLEY